MQLIVHARNPMSRKMVLRQMTAHQTCRHLAFVGLWDMPNTASSIGLYVSVRLGRATAVLPRVVNPTQMRDLSERRLS